MTREDVIQMAQKAGFVWLGEYHSNLEDFAKLVAEHEREACAKACYEEANKHPIGLDSWWATTHCAQAIEARGQA